MASPSTVFLKVPALEPVDTAGTLKKLRRKTVIFPSCALELLSLIKTNGVEESKKDDVTKFFDEYFKFGKPHQVLAEFAQGETWTNLFDGKLFDCSSVDAPTGAVNRRSPVWPSECCICRPCLTLDGGRNGVGNAAVPGIQRLFIGDLAWLFYMDRLGLFQVLGVILDAFATNGRLPISNGAIKLDVDSTQDDILAVVLEIMVRQMKTGLASSVRDRNSAYRTSLGWVSDAGRKLDLQTEVNVGFSQLFHKFIFHALEFYKDKRLTVAIQGAAGGGSARPSVATLITISDTLNVLNKRFESFDYGRNYYNTLGGIVWAIAALSVVRELRTTLGIPPAYNDPYEYIPAAYDLLVLKRPVTQGETNRYLLHRECAVNSRDILLDLEVINHTDKSPEGELDRWLNQIEAKIEGYRTAYRTLTGIDLGAPGTPAIEQQV